MYNFEYVSKKEAAPAKNELIEIINEVQDILRNKDVSFQFQFIGSSSRNMITCDRKSNIGYDFDVNLDVFYDEDRYAPGEIKHIFRCYEPKTFSDEVREGFTFSLFTLHFSLNRSEKFFGSNK